MLTGVGIAQSTLFVIAKFNRGREMYDIKPHPSAFDKVSPSQLRANPIRCDKIQATKIPRPITVNISPMYRYVRGVVNAQTTTADEGNANPLNRRSWNIRSETRNL
jgi:hypothetical protein